jgi:hypothetical protein
MKTWCVPTRSDDMTLQSNAVSGSTKRGAPVVIVAQEPTENRSSLAVFVRPANTSETNDWSSRSTFTQKQPLSMMVRAVGDFS